MYFLNINTFHARTFTYKGTPLQIAEKKKEKIWDRIHLTHLEQDKMDIITQMTFSNGFSWTKTFDFQINF